MPNAQITEMLKKPGVHCITEPGADGFARVEVLENGECHQLTPDGKRDGVLSPEGWHESTIVIEDPFKQKE